jgi:hypothetical protein
LNYYLAQLHNVSLSSEKYSVDLLTYIDSQSKLSHPISNEGYEIPVKITNNEYLELCSDTCEYLDLSRTPTVHMVDGKDSEAESIPEDIHLLYCNMSAEQL